MSPVSNIYTIMTYICTYEGIGRYKKTQIFKLSRFFSETLPLFYTTCCVSIQIILDSEASRKCQLWRIEVYIRLVQMNTSGCQHSFH